MGRDDEPHFTMHDATICIWTKITSDKTLYGKLKRAMKGLGFTWVRDPHIVKNYPSLAKTHHYGRLKDLEFCSEIYPAGMKFEFFQNVVFENPNGGKYDFRRVEKMPYLTKLQFVRATTKLKALLAKEGVEDRSTPRFDRAIDFVMYRRAEIERFHGQGFYKRPGYSYNNTDADGNTLKDGDFRYYRDYYGRLGKGVVYANLNNMWWVVANDSTWNNVGSHNLFSWKPGIKRRERYNPLQRMKGLLERLVKDQNFERAIGLRDAISREEAKAGRKQLVEAS